MRETQVPLIGSAKEQEDRTDAEEEFLPKPRLTVNRRFENPSRRNTTGAKVFFLTTLLVLSVMFLITTTSNNENNLMSDNYDRRISSGQTQIGHGNANNTWDLYNRLTHTDSLDRNSSGTPNTSERVHDAQRPVLQKYPPVLRVLRSRPQLVLGH